MAASSAAKLTVTSWGGTAVAALELPKFVCAGTLGRETLADGGGKLAKFEFWGEDTGGGATAAVGEKPGANVGGPAGAVGGG